MKNGKQSHFKANLALAGQIIAVVGGLVAFFEKDLFLGALVLLLAGVCEALWVVLSRRESPIVPGLSVYRHSKARRIWASLIGAMIAMVSVFLVIRWMSAGEENGIEVIEVSKGLSLGETSSKRGQSSVRDGFADYVWIPPEISFRKYSGSGPLPLPISSGDTVYSEDSVGAKVSVAEDTCLVAILSGSTGTASRLIMFDRDDVEVNQITAVAKSVVFLPSVNRGWRLDNEIGWEVFYVLASSSPFEENEVSRLLHQISRVKVRGVDGVEDHAVSAADMSSILNGDIASFFAARKEEFSYSSMPLRHEARVVE